MTEYDIGAAFQSIENELIRSMIRNMDRHRAEETKEGFEWSMWQTKQLKALEKYKRDNQKRYGKKFSSINREVGELIRQARQTGNMQQEIRILQAIKKGFKVHGRNKSRSHQAMTAEFFQINDRKLESLIRATTSDMERAETAILRMANDKYRKAIFNAQVYANSGAGTYESAVDMATRDMLSSGLNCIEYKNGARHTLSDYADMAIRTASKRAYLHGEGEKRQEWGITTVIVNKRGNACPRCLPFVGKVMIDDVWSGGTADDGPYPLMSSAIEAGLYHPRCKDSHTTYFPGISTADGTWTQKELKAIGRDYKREQQQQHANRQAERYGRMAAHSLDDSNRKRYAQAASEWSDRETEALTMPEEGAVVRYVSPDAYALNDKLRRKATDELTNHERAWMRNLDGALSKLPNYEGDLNRSLTFAQDGDARKFFDSLEKGGEYTPDQYLSTTKTGMYNDDGQVQIYIQDAKGGKDLGGLSIENEVLYPSGSSFGVINKVYRDGKYWVLLKEV